MTDKPWVKYQSGPWQRYSKADPEAEQESNQPTGMLSSPTAFTEGMAGGIKNGIIGVADLALTGITAGAAEIASGYAGIVALGLSRGDVDYAADRVREWQEKLTRPIQSEAGESIINTIAPPLSRADAAITNFAEDKSGGQPAAAAAIKTAIYGALDIAGALLPLTKPLKDLSKVRKIRSQIIQDAERLGIEIKLSDFADDVQKAASEVGSSQRGQLSAEYAQALRNAEYVARLKKNSKYMEAMDTNLNVETSMMRKLKRDLLDQNSQDSLVFKYDLTDKKMYRVRDTLALMDRNYFSSDKIATNFKRVESFRQQLNGKINSAKGGEKAALIQIKNTLDNQLNIEFNNAMLQNGRSALSGDTGALQTWMDARKLAQKHSWFNDTRVIADLIKKEATPEQMSTWVMGATVVGGKKQAGMVINKIKKLLGDDHQAIDAIRQDFVYELMAPLLKEEPNWKTFLNRYDTMIKNNHTVVNALGVDSSDAAVLKKFAMVAEKLPPEGTFYTLREIIGAFSQITVGHEVAQGAARVKFTTRVLNMIAGQDAVSKGEILGALENVYHGSPIIPSDSLAAAGITAGAAISGTMDEN